MKSLAEKYLINPRLKQLDLEAKKMFSSAKGCHDWDHTERVLNLCIRIGEKEGADLDILVPAAVLHDIGREQEEKSKWKTCHAKIGAELARPILKKHGYSKKQIDQIAHCIQTHRFKNSLVPESLEAKILYDADKLDAIGAIGIGRAFVFSGEIGARVHHPDITLENSEEYSRNDTAYRHYLDKLSKIKDKLLTEEGKAIAGLRHIFMEEFFDRLNQEVFGVL